MVVPVVKVGDELLPELEMSVIPSKISDNVKVDLFGLSEKFLKFLADRGCIGPGENSDTQYMPMAQAFGFCKDVRDLYKIYKAQGDVSANI